MDIKSVIFMTNMKARINLKSYSNVMYEQMVAFFFFTSITAGTEPILLLPKKTMQT